MRFTPSPAYPFASPHPKFARSVVAGAISGNADKMLMKSQPVEPVAVPKAIVSKISPKKIRKGQVANRCEEAFFNEDFEELCESIQRGQGNAVPILVRPVAMNADGSEFTLIYGERRLRACEAVGVDVLAIIKSDEDTNSEFMVMVRENLCRIGLSPIELGQQAKYAHEHKAVASLRAFAREIGKSTSCVTEAVKLAQLPEAVLKAFRNPKELQFRDAKPLTDAVKANLPAVLAEIENIKSADDVPSTKDMVARLIDAAGSAVRPSNDADETVLKCLGERFGQMLFDKSGKVEITFDKAMADKYRRVLEKHLVDYYKKKILRVGLNPRAQAWVQP